MLWLCASAAYTVRACGPLGHWDDGDKADAILDVLTDCAREDAFRLKRDGVTVLYSIHFDL